PGSGRLQAAALFVPNRSYLAYLADLPPETATANRKVVPVVPMAMGFRPVGAVDLAAIGSSPVIYPVRSVVAAGSLLFQIGFATATAADFAGLCSAGKTAAFGLAVTGFPVRQIDRFSCPVFFAAAVGEAVSAFVCACFSVFRSSFS